MLRRPLTSPLASPLRAPLSSSLPWEGGGGGAPWSPAALGSALTVWLEQSGIAGSPIDSWTSKVGSVSYTATLTTRPAVTTANGITVADCDGSNDIMSSVTLYSAITSATAWEVMAVVALDAAPADGAYTTAAALWGESVGGHVIGFNQSGIRCSGYDGTVRTTGYVTCAQDGVRRVVGGRLDGGNVYASVGNTDSAGVACGSEQLRGGTIQIVRFASAVAIDGRFCEMIVTNRALTAAERASARAYFAARFATAAL